MVNALFKSSSVPALLLHTAAAAQPLPARSRVQGLGESCKRDSESCCVVQVRKFWTKVGKVVEYKEQQMVNGLKKKVWTGPCPPWPQRPGQRQCRA